MTPYEDIRVEGHLIDSGIMSAIMDAVVELEGEFETLSFEVGRTNDDASVALLRIKAPSDERLDEILHIIQEHGAVPVDPSDADLAPAPADGVLPDRFYSTTNLQTWIRIGGKWVAVQGVEMDLGVCVDLATGTARSVPMAEVRTGDICVVGHKGLRIKPQERPRDRQAFEFMNSAVSSEKPKAQVVAEVARLLRESRKAGKGTIVVAGPAVVPTGAASHQARLVRLGAV
ncbi:MAG: TIGR00300 family protein, partial [Actinomycetota bacterium]|nr:TIGR00300 family protein [Actinomycetota bacterium]